MPLQYRCGERIQSESKKLKYKLLECGINVLELHSKKGKKVRLRTNQMKKFKL